MVMWVSVYKAKLARYIHLAKISTRNERQMSREGKRATKWIW